MDQLDCAVPKDLSLISQLHFDPAPCTLCSSLVERNLVPDGQIASPAVHDTSFAACSMPAGGVRSQCLAKPAGRGADITGLLHLQPMSTSTFAISVGCLSAQVQPSRRAAQLPGCHFIKTGLISSCTSAAHSEQAGRHCMGSGGNWQ